jgi:hypothetical protein
MKHCSLGQYSLLASGNQPNQNLTQPKIHTRNKGKFLHKNRLDREQKQNGKKTFSQTTYCCCAHRSAKKNHGRGKINLAHGPRAWPGNIISVREKKNKQAMKITSFPWRMNQDESAADTRRAEREE